MGQPLEPSNAPTQVPSSLFEGLQSPQPQNQSQQQYYQQPYYQQPPPLPPAQQQQQPQQQQYYQRAAQPSTGGYQAAQRPYPSSYQQQPQPQQQPYRPPMGQPRGFTAGYSTAAAAAQGSVTPKELQRINPGKASVNAVALLGTLSDAIPEGPRSAAATLHVPYATKDGTQPFIIQAWDNDVPHLMSLQGVKVVVEGRLRLDPKVGVKVVADRIKVVDESLAPTTIRTGVAGTSGRGRSSGGGVSSNSGEAAEEGQPGGRERMEPQKVWKIHYETQTQTLEELAGHFGRPVGIVRDALLRHAFLTSSPLRYRALAQEAGLAVDDGSEEISLMDFINVVAAYRAEFATAAAAAQPGAAPPAPRLTKDGMLRVRPILDWALARDQMDTYRYVVEQYRAKYGDSNTYDALRLAVVAEATQGVWDAGVEFKPLEAP